MATVLVIEDEAPIRANLERFLKAEGYTVLAASDGAGGLAAAREQRPDIIICDILMPQVDGFRVLAELRADAGTTRIPLIFLTASADKEDRQRGLASGATDYVTKPFKLAELLAVIRKHLGGVASKDE
jgi:two-component system, sensor histidine kinase and response regulator